MKINVGKGEIIETDNATSAELRALHDLLIVQVQELRSKIQGEWESAKKNGGGYDDPDAHGRRVVAKKKLGQIIEQLKVIISDRRKAENALRGESVNAEFLALCRERMDRDLFLSLIEEAKKRAEAQ